VFRPHDKPNVAGAAHALSVQLEALPSQTDRAQLLSDLCVCLGDTWYPIFLRLLTVTSEIGPANAQHLLAESVVYAMQRGQTPGGTLSSWGVPPNVAAITQQLGQGFFRSPAKRALDPISYTCAWFSQATSRQPLPRQVFERTMSSLLALFSVKPEIATIYQAKLCADRMNLPDGTFSKSTRLRLDVLISLWASNERPRQIASAVADTEVPHGISQVLR
jgi:hypothetical protein